VSAPQIQEKWIRYLTKYTRNAEGDLIMEARVAHPEIMKRNRLTEEAQAQMNRSSDQLDVTRKRALEHHRSVKIDISQAKPYTPDNPFKQHAPKLHEILQWATDPRTRKIPTDKVYLATDGCVYSGESVSILKAEFQKLPKEQQKSSLANYELPATSDGYMRDISWVMGLLIASPQRVQRGSEGLALLLEFFFSAVRNTPGLFADEDKPLVYSDNVFKEGISGELIDKIAEKFTDGITYSPIRHVCVYDSGDFCSAGSAVTQRVSLMINLTQEDEQSIPALMNTWAKHSKTRLAQTSTYFLSAINPSAAVCATEVEAFGPLFQYAMDAYARPTGEKKPIGIRPLAGRPITGGQGTSVDPSGLTTQRPVIQPSTKTMKLTSASVNALKNAKAQMEISRCTQGVITSLLRSALTPDVLYYELSGGQKLRQELQNWDKTHRIRDPPVQERSRRLYDAALSGLESTEPGSTDTPKVTTAFLELNMVSLTECATSPAGMAIDITRMLSSNTLSALYEGVGWYIKSTGGEVKTERTRLHATVAMLPLGDSDFRKWMFLMQRVAYGAASSARIVPQYYYSWICEGPKVAQWWNDDSNAVHVGFMLSQPFDMTISDWVFTMAEQELFLIGEPPANIALRKNMITDRINEMIMLVDQYAAKTARSSIEVWPAGNTARSYGVDINRRSRIPMNAWMTEWLPTNLMTPDEIWEDCKPAAAAAAAPGKEPELNMPHQKLIALDRRYQDLFNAMGRTYQARSAADFLQHYIGQRFRFEIWKMAEESIHKLLHRVADPDRRYIADMERYAVEQQHLVLTMH
jgi:hypothetical protein